MEDHRQVDPVREHEDFDACSNKPIPSGFGC